MVADGINPRHIHLRSSHPFAISRHHAHTGHIQHGLVRAREHPLQGLGGHDVQPGGDAESRQQGDLRPYEETRQAQALVSCTVKHHAGVRVSADDVGHAGATHGQRCLMFQDEG